MLFKGLFGGDSKQGDNRETALGRYNGGFFSRRDCKTGFHRKTLTKCNIKLFYVIFTDYSVFSYRNHGEQGGGEMCADILRK